MYPIYIGDIYQAMSGTKSVCSSSVYLSSSFDAQNVKPEHKRSMAGFALRLKIMACLLRSSEAANTPALAVQVRQGSC